MWYTKLTPHWTLSERLVRPLQTSSHHCLSCTRWCCAPSTGQRLRPRAEAAAAVPWVSGTATAAPMVAFHNDGPAGVWSPGGQHRQPQTDEWGEGTSGAAGPLCHRTPVKQNMGWQSSVCGRTTVVHPYSEAQPPKAARLMPCFLPVRRWQGLHYKANEWDLLVMNDLISSFLQTAVTSAFLLQDTLLYFATLRASCSAHSPQEPVRLPGQRLCCRARWPAARKHGAGRRLQQSHGGGRERLHAGRWQPGEDATAASAGTERVAVGSSKGSDGRRCGV